ncbi:MAG TPA: glycoside hydrolase family 97 protein [Vicinamibacterales bacterium]|nr:glycoside hydrolase family 97 protein [Vicinamibacterales bacterium]
MNLQAVLIAAFALMLMVRPSSARAPAPQPPAPLTVSSPNGAVTVTVATGSGLTYAVSAHGRELIQPSKISMTLQGGEVLGADPVVLRSATRSGDQVLRPVVPIKRAEIVDRYRELRIDFRGDYSLVLRAYDDGVAYRFALARPSEVIVESEQAAFEVAGNPLVYFPEDKGFITHQERPYRRVRLGDIGPAALAYPPVLLVPDDGRRIAITEADLRDYPGMSLTRGSAGGLAGLFPQYPATTEMVRDRTERVPTRENWIARTRGTREFPWRVLVVAGKDADLLETDIVYRLAAENTLADTSWIRPGKVAWDWWNFNNLYAVPFRAGVNTDTYKHYIDFAAEHGIEYIILDEGWYKLGDLTSVVPQMDMDAIAAHAKARKVGLIMWVVWKTFDQQMEATLDRFEKWGVKGIKVDFMQRDDQWMVNFYERVAHEAAKRRMLVNFHGAYKPTGLYRTYPNVLTSEGVIGLEHNKWSADASPEHNVTFPFMRMMAGPVDYTPGGMLNATKPDFKPVFNRPVTQGTRCHQLAMYIVYESPLQMLADSPSNYRREPESLAFISAVPVVWDDMRVLDAKVGEYILIARRRGRDWFIGAMTNWTARSLEVDLGFLGSGRWTAEIHRDGPNADRAAVDYVREMKQVTAGQKLRIQLAPGGGWAARLRPR